MRHGVIVPSSTASTIAEVALNNSKKVLKRLGRDGFLDIFCYFRNTE